MLSTNLKMLLTFFLLLFFWCAPFGHLYFLSFQLLNKPGLGAGIDPGMALTPLPSSIGWDQTHDLLIVSRVLYR
jgi:hypothetical protein